MGGWGDGSEGGRACKCVKICVENVGVSNALFYENLTCVCQCMCMCMCMCRRKILLDDKLQKVHTHHIHHIHIRT